jgi:membrane dipeptidase
MVSMKVDRNKSIVLFLCIFVTLIYGQDNYKRIHEEAIVADLHDDAIYRFFQGQDIETYSRFTQFDLVKMRQGGVDVQFFALWPDPKNRSQQSMYDQTEDRLDSLLAIFNRHQDIIELATTPDRIRQIVDKGKTAACFGLEGGTAIDNDLNKLEYFYNRGVQYLGLTWNDSPDWASSAKNETDPSWPGKKGLSEFGVSVIKKMNQLGMMIDVSHSGEQTFYDALKYSNKPIIASHSSVYAICPHYRNLKDAQITAMAEKGGVMFINFYPGYLVKDFDDIYMNSRKEADAIEDSLKKAGSTKEFNRSDFIHSEIKNVYPDVSVVVDHIAYVIDLVGEDYVGLGSDFAGFSIPPAGLENVSKFPNVTKELLKRGYSVSTIKKILGGNFMRVFKEVSENN